MKMMVCSAIVDFGRERSANRVNLGSKDERNGRAVALRTAGKRLRLKTTTADDDIPVGSKTV